MELLKVKKTQYIHLLGIHNNLRNVVITNKEIESKCKFNYYMDHIVPFPSDLIEIRVLKTIRESKSIINYG